MKKYCFLMIGALALAGCAGSGDEPVAPEVPEVPFVEVERPVLSSAESRAADALGAFDKKFVATALSGPHTSNVAVSPLGTSMFLSMMANSVDAADAAKITSLLGVSDLDACNSFASKYMEWLPAADNLVDVAIANGIWYRNDKAIRSDFSSAATDFYNMEFTPMNFGKPEALKETVSEWAKKKSRGLIDNLNIGDVSKLPAVMANALAFQGQWTDVFDEKNTVSAPFYPTATAVAVKMMEKTGDMAYAFTPDFQAVRMDYGKGQYSMTLLLPAQGTAPSDMLAKNVDAVYSAEFNTRKVNLSLPRFSIKPQLQLQLHDVLADMGLPGSGNMIFNNLYTEAASYDESGIYQLTAMEVNEKGTKAASITYNGEITMGGGETKPDIVEVKFDRPFAFLIQENNTGLTLFAGIVCRP